MNKGGCFRSSIFCRSSGQVWNSGVKLVGFPHIYFLLIFCSFLCILGGLYNMYVVLTLCFSCLVVILFSSALFPTDLLAVLFYCQAHSDVTLLVCTVKGMWEGRVNFVQPPTKFVQNLLWTAKTKSWVFYQAPMPGSDYPDWWASNAGSVKCLKLERVVSVFFNLQWEEGTI